MSDTAAVQEALPATRKTFFARRRRQPPALPGQPELTSRQRWLRRLPLMPAFIYTIVVTQVPFVVTLWYSFRGWNTLTPGTNHWVGLKEYKLLFEDPVFFQAVKNTFLITLSAAVIAMFLAVVFAVALNRKFRGRAIARTLLITPFLMMSTATALLFKTTIYDPVFGLLNWALGPVGVHHVNWVGVHAVPAVVIVLIWEWTPFMMLIVLAGLQGESLEALEAARVDGANAIQTFFHITFPHILQYIQLGLLLGSIYLLQAFGEIFILTQGGGGHGTATTNLPYYIYELAFNQFSVSQAAAAGVIVVIGTEIVATIVLRLLKALFANAEVLG